MGNKVTERIIALRKEAGIGAAEMAEKLGVTRQTYHSRESGKSTWTLDELEKIADALSQKITVADLVA